MSGDEKGAYDGPKPGDGYAIEIAGVRKILKPLEESVVAARKIKDDWKSMASGINNAATIEIEKPAKEVLSEWGFGMGRVAEHTDVIVETLRQVIAAYMLADLLRVKDFSPTEDNMAKLPFGEHGLRGRGRTGTAGSSIRLRRSTRSPGWTTANRAATARPSRVICPPTRAIGSRARAAKAGWSTADRGPSHDLALPDVPTSDTPRGTRWWKGPPRMTQKDAMEGGTAERLPPHAEPDEVIPGDPDKIDDLVVKLRAYAGAFKDGYDKLTDLSLLPWTGAGSRSFEDASKSLPRELESARKYFKSAAGALDAYADKLRSVHKRVKPIIKDADEIRAASKAHWKKVKAYNDAVDRGDETLPERPPDEDPITGLDSCYSRLDKLEKELQGVVDDSKSTLDKAAEKAPDPPKGWNRFKKGAKDFFGGAGDSVHGMWKQFEYLTEDGLDGAGLQLAGMVDGAAYAAHHPKEFAKAVVNWEEWQRNPSRAAGQLTPDLLLALASGGGGRAAQGRLGSQERRPAAGRPGGRALRRDGSARDRADGPDQSDVGSGEKKGLNEPVDAATGEMFTSATDVALPGDLPLLLERHYVSGHPCGGWFGPTWAGTLDQRVELDERGIVFVADDGMVLSYPVPEADVPVLPVSGPRWPLCWDGKPDGTMTITAPERNRTLHFAPLPAGGRELALRAISDRAGNRIDIAYDQTGAPQRVTHSGGYRIAVDTDPDLMRITALRMLHGPDQERSTLLVSYRYDPAGDLAEILNSTGQPLRYRYDEAHRITSWTDRNGTAFGYVYDHRGRVLRTIGPDGTFSGRFHYDQAARTTRYTDSQGHQSLYVHNEAHRIVAETDPLGHTTRTEWDAANRHPVAVTDPLGRTTRYTYDEAGNLTRIQRPDGSTTTALYDDDCLPLEIRDPNGGLWRHTWDDLGNRTSSTTDPAGTTTRYTYNQAGHLTSVTDPLGHTTTVTPNPAGLPTTLTDPLGHTTHIHRGPHGPHHHPHRPTGPHHPPRLDHRRQTRLAGVRRRCLGGVEVGLRGQPRLPHRHRGPHHGVHPHPLRPARHPHRPGRGAVCVLLRHRTAPGGGHQSAGQVVALRVRPGRPAGRRDRLQQRTPDLRTGRRRRPPRPHERHGRAAHLHPRPPRPPRRTTRRDQRRGDHIRVRPGRRPRPHRQRGGGGDAGAGRSGPAAGRDGQRTQNVLHLRRGGPPHQPHDTVRPHLRVDLRRRRPPDIAVDGRRHAHLHI